MKANNEIVHQMKKIGYTTNGVNGFKGAFLKILTDKILISNNPTNKIKEIFRDKDKLVNFLDEEIFLKKINL